MSEVQQKRTLLVVLCTDLLAGSEIRKCIEQATLPYGIDLDYGSNPFLRSGLGDDLADASLDFTVHSTQGSPIAGLVSPEARISPPVPYAPLRPLGLNVSVLGESIDDADVMAYAIRRQFQLAGCTHMLEFQLENAVDTEEFIVEALSKANIGAVVVRFLNPMRQMTFGELIPRLAGMRRAPQR